jgi:hypothetical protein
VLQSSKFEFVINLKTAKAFDAIRHQPTMIEKLAQGEKPEGTGSNSRT